MKANLAYLRTQHRKKLSGFHFEEAAFLYEQQQALKLDASVPWTDLDSIERRAITHINALTVHGDIALKYCSDDAHTGLGELHVALRLVAQQDNWTSALKLCSEADLEDPDVRLAIANALLFSAPDSWRDHLTDLVEHADFPLKQIAAKVLGSKRQVESELLLRVLSNEAPSICTDFIWAIGRCGKLHSASALNEYLYSDDEDIAGTAAVALQRLGSTLPQSVAAEKFPSMRWPESVLALASTESGVETLLEIVRHTPTEKSVLALGFCGVFEADALLPLLDDTNLAAASAQALQLITGAGLQDEVWVADSVASEELFDEELVEYEKNGTLPTRSDGRPFGQAEFLDSRNRSDWERWLDEHQPLFKAGERYRLGLPVSQNQTIKTLVDPAYSTQTRLVVADELVAHYNSRLIFEADWPVSLQVASLQSIAGLSQQ